VPNQKKKIILIPLLLFIVGLTMSNIIPSTIGYVNYLSNETLSPILDINTRIKEIPFEPSILVNSTLTKFGSGCPPDLVIYIHGFNRDDVEAQEEFNRIQTSLLDNSYRIPLVGVSWDSKVLWPIAKDNAENNGLLLEQYLVSLQEKCPDTKIRIVAHSLGAVIVDTAIFKLSNNPEWNGKISSVHLLGAAIDNKLISNHTLAIEQIVDKFYNLYNPEDDGLKFNQIFENHSPLGLVGAPNGFNYTNYVDTNVAYEISPVSDADGDGIIAECFEELNLAKLWGDNHCGYIGFRDPASGSLSDDGAMNIVVRDWIKS
jgi:hypothetical protein